MEEARGMIDKWAHGSEEAGVDQRRQDFLLAVVSHCTAHIDSVIQIQMIQ